MDSDWDSLHPYDPIEVIKAFFVKLAGIQRIWVVIRARL
jgi:hypothetical protein